MTVATTLIYRFACDWPKCPETLTVHGEDTMPKAVARIRREGWTVSSLTTRRAKGGPRTRMSCLRHSWLPWPGV